MSLNFSLGNDENVIAEIKHSIFPFIGYWLIAVLFCAVGVLCFFGLSSYTDMGWFPLIVFIICSLGGIIIAILLVLSLSSERLILTDKRIIGTKGFLARRTTEIVLDKADAVTVSNSFMGAVFKYSTVSVVTPGLHTVSNGTTVKDRFCYVTNAVEFSSAFTRAVEDYNSNKKN